MQKYQSILISTKNILLKKITMVLEDVSSPLSKILSNCSLTIRSEFPGG
jgi:hypothetical protein